MAVSREDVVEAALKLLDSRGLAGVTLRAVAAELGVQAPTLYWHVQDKRHLLDLMARRLADRHRIFEAGGPRPGQEVWDWLAESCRRQRRSLLGHPDVIHILAGNRPTVESLPLIEELVTVMVEAGLPAAEAVLTIQAFGSYVLGDVLESQAGAGREPPAELVEAVRSGAYPTMAAAFAEGGGDGDERFEAGLGLLVGGLRARLDALRGAVGLAPAGARAGAEPGGLGPPAERIGRAGPSGGLGPPAERIGRPGPSGGLGPPAERP